MGSKNVSKRSKDIGDETGSGSEKEMKTSPTETSFEDNPGFRNSVQPIGHQIQPDSFNGGIEANKLIGKDDIVVVKESPTAILDSNENLIEASSGHGSNMLYNLKKISSNSSETVEMPPSTISRLFQVRLHNCFSGYLALHSTDEVFNLILGRSLMVHTVDTFFPTQHLILVAKFRCKTHDVKDQKRFVKI